MAIHFVLPTAIPVIMGAIKTASFLIGAGKIAIIPFLIASFAYFHYDQFDPENRPVDKFPVDAEYDFIVVGSGTAGSVVANRLSEIPEWKVLLLEAGGHESEITDVPIMSIFLHRSAVDWKYRTQPSTTACQAMNDKRCCWTRGKVLGGSSVLNTMLYIRGNRRDFDLWEALGNPGWGYKDILYYFKKSEDQRNPYLAKDTKYHGTGGYQTVQDAPYNTPIGVGFLEAAQEMGYEIRDINGEKQTGFALYQYTMRRAARCSAAKAFLRPVRLRRNLHVSLLSHVTRVIIDPQTREAKGIEFIKGGKKYTVRARKEVILSAGAVATPHLLMLSGIGPRENLEKVGVPVIHDSPGVGQNVQDHIAVGGIAFLIDYPITTIMNRLINLNSALRYALKEDGPLTSSIGLETVGFISTKYANQSDDWPDMNFMMTTTTTSADGGDGFIKRAHCLTDEFYQEMFGEIFNKDAFGIFPMMLRPKSRGEIKLHSKNPLRYPLIYHNYLTHPDDVGVLREGVKAAVAVGETEAMKKFGSRFYRKPVPNCKHLPLFTDAYWDCAIRQYTMTIYHMSCSAKMGPADDPYAVTDPTLRVYGVSGLRIIDASVMPRIPSGNINAPVQMVGEKGADMVKEYWLGTIDNSARKRRRKRSAFGKWEVMFQTRLNNSTESGPVRYASS